MLKTNEIYNGDCMELMDKIDDKSIDLILCDLPYGITARNKWDSIIPFNEFMLINNKVYYKDDFFLKCFNEDIKKQEALIMWNSQKQKGLWDVYNRIIKDNGVIVLTASKPFTSQLINSNKKMFRYSLVWQKTTPTGFLNANKMPLRSHEDILVFYKKLPIYNPQKTTGHTPVHTYTKHQDDGNNYGKTNIGMSGGGSTERYPTSILKFATDKQKSAIHPTQKPVSLFEWLIRTYTSQNAVILDNCSGSGTTAIATVNNP